MVLLFLALAGCERSDDKITVYRIPKETEKTPASAQTVGVRPKLRWTAPSGWEEQPASGFRKGSYLVRGADGKTADISVITFPENAGGLLANVNRWREQLKLAPVPDEAQTGTAFSLKGREMFFVDIVSREPLAENSKTRILGGIFPVTSETCFFKMTGPDQLVEAQREAFKAFLESVEVDDGSAASPTTNSAESTNAAPPPLLSANATGPLHYTLPANWKEKPLAPMRLASFDACPAGGKQADVSIVTLGKMAGGDLANVNRWRDQVKLAPIDEAALAQSAEHVQADGKDYLVIDLVSEGALGEAKEKQRIIAAIFNENDRSWFIKMTGPDDVVASEKPAFRDFLRSLKLP